MLGALFATGNSVITEVGQKVVLKCGPPKFVGTVEWSHERIRIYKVEPTGQQRKGLHKIRVATINKNSFFIFCINNIALYVCSALGPSHIKDKSKMRSDDLEITNVNEKDNGKFVCSTKTESYEQTLAVVSGEMLNLNTHSSQCFTECMIS